MEGCPGAPGEEWEDTACDLEQSIKQRQSINTSILCYVMLYYII